MQAHTSHHERQCGARSHRDGRHGPGEPRISALPRSSLLRSAALAALIASAGCASTGSQSAPFSGVGPGDTSSSHPGSFASNPDFLPGTEVRAASVGNLYEVVERLRPLWLRTGGSRTRSARIPTEIMVVMNQAYFGPASSLRSLTPEHVRSIRYLDGSAATARFSYPGAQPHIAGAIVVEMGYTAEES